jgi:hypothetical protein
VVVTRRWRRDVLTVRRGEDSQWQPDLGVGIVVVARSGHGRTLNAGGPSRRAPPLLASPLGIGQNELVPSSGDVIPGSVQA